MIRVLILLALTGSVFAQAKPEDLVIVKSGTLPIVLSAPHGGRTPIPDALLRRGVGVEQFATVRDDNTDQLTLKIAAHLEKLLDGKPHVVIAKFERKYADANRPAVNAYESDAAKPVYEHYHKSLTAAVKAIDGVGIVIDIHGQGAETNTIFRGTANGKAVKHLVDRHGEAALSGPKSIFGYLGRHDVTVHPPVGSKEPENRNYNGGYIVQTYGSASGGRIDAIQMVFGTILRQKPQLDITASAVADAIAAFAVEYLQVRKK
jgi:N-formylglutamate amidohydrolase